MRYNIDQLNHTQVSIPDSELVDPVLTSPSPGLWRLNYTYYYADVERDEVIVIPAGFEFDLATIPRPIWWLIAPFDLSIVAPLVHDFQYYHKGITPTLSGHVTYSRRESDRLFNRIMKDESVPMWRRRLAYSAVRAFGWAFW